MVAFVGVERRDAGSFVRSIVVSEFSKGKECGPIILLIGNVVSEILFESLIYAFGLTVRFGMITSSEMEFHIESLT